MLLVSRLSETVGMSFYFDPPLAQPHISSVHLASETNPVMLILACDGVWDVLSDQEAADLLLERYQLEGPFTNAAKILVR